MKSLVANTPAWLQTKDSEGMLLLTAKPLPHPHKKIR